jgi:hypothetical protein
MGDAPLHALSHWPTTNPAAYDLGPANLTRRSNTVATVLDFNKFSLLWCNHAHVEGRGLCGRSRKPDKGGNGNSSKTSFGNHHQ